MCQAFAFILPGVFNFVITMRYIYIVERQPKFFTCVHCAQPHNRSLAASVGRDAAKTGKQGTWWNYLNQNQVLGLETNRGCFPVFLPDTVRDTFLIDPAVILIVVGVVMFFITFCGCIGALRENIHLLKTVIDLTDTLQILAQCFASI